MVTHRTEIGIRSSIGAGRARVLGEILREGMLLLLHPRPPAPPAWIRGHPNRSVS
jgi:hypothetical protein